MTCARFGRDQICMQVKASFTPFGHPTQVNASQVTSISLLLANEIQEMSALKCFFCDLHVLVRKLACLFGHPTRKSLRKFNLPLLTATSEPVWPGLKSLVGDMHHIHLLQYVSICFFGKNLMMDLLSFFCRLFIHE